MGNFNFDILDVLTLLNIPFSANTGRISFDINCPFCANDTQKHMNINVQKNVFRCNRCGAHGGMLDLYGLCQNIHEYKECFKEVTERLNGSPFYENCKQKRVIVNEPLEEPYKPVDIEKLLSIIRVWAPQLEKY